MQELQFYILYNYWRGVAQSGSASGLGPEGHRFKSCLPDKMLVACAMPSARGKIKGLRSLGSTGEFSMGVLTETKKTPRLSRGGHRPEMY